jgi:hypothetical protein
MSYIDFCKSRGEGVRHVALSEQVISADLNGGKIGVKYFNGDASIILTFSDGGALFDCSPGEFEVLRHSVAETE